MDIFEFGMKMEEDGEAFYREIAEKSADKGMKAILTLLADSEVKHYNVLKKMKEHSETGLDAVTLMPEVKNVFEQMKDDKGDLDADVSQVEMYSKAREIELKSEVFYREQADAAEAPAARDIFVQLADEEKEHAVILDNICDMLSRPDAWMENAEWRNMGEY
jgi:rubrerythrin